MNEEDIEARRKLLETLPDRVEDCEDCGDKMCEQHQGEWVDHQATVVELDVKRIISEL